MTSGDWRQIEEIFQEALQHDPAQRDAYVREACGGDAELQREVLSLLANNDQGSDFKPWAAAAAAQLIDTTGLLRPGQSLGPYRIQSFLAAGGMGEVYRATDTRLNRPVAIKVSAERFSERFEREARAIASLNHPNICTLHDIGPNYLVMEYVEGKTLAERISQGHIPPPEALVIARQMAAALEEAHQKFVVHRDFKPGNVKIKPDGTVKVLDFGLAKLAAVQTKAGGNATNSPTLTIAATEAGMLLGTVAYMSPEQARGQPVDKRSDVWAFGVVLWEMLTGKQLFQGKTASDVLASVIRDEPDLSQVPAKVRPLLKRCLEKEPQRRLRDIGDAMGIVENTPEVQQPSTRLVWIPGIVATILLVALCALAFVHFREMPPETRAMITSINPPENTGFNPAGFNYNLSNNAFALSPDGRQIVFSAREADGKSQLWVRPVDSPTPQPLHGTEEATFPFWSPDNRSVGFFSDGKLKRIDVGGGPALILADAPNGAGGSWSPREIIVFAPNLNSTLQRVAANGGVTTAATTIDPSRNSSHYLPWFLPDGRHFLFASRIGPGSTEWSLEIGALDSPEVKTIGPANSPARYSSGYLLYVRQNTLMAQPFDEKHLTITGAAQSVAGQVPNVLPPTGPATPFSAAGIGLLAYRTGTTSNQQLTWFDRSGKPLGTLGDVGFFWSVEFSPDRKRVAVCLGGENDDIWIYDVQRGLPTRFTVSPAAERTAVWSPDGQDIIFNSNAAGQFDLYRKAADGTGKEELLFTDVANKIPQSWSPDGKFLLFFRVDRTTLQDIWVLPITPGAPSKPYPWLATPFREAHVKFSLDGHWVVYESNKSGRFEIYVAPFPGPGSEVRISSGGGNYPRWRADGKEIFYMANGTLIAAEVAIHKASVDVGAVRSLGIPVTAPDYRYDVTADGQRFLVAKPREQKSFESLMLVYNWTALLKKK